MLATAACRDVYFRERFAEISGAVWKRLEGDVVPKRGIPNHVPQEIASVCADVDAVGIGREGQRNEETQCLVVSHCAPGLTRPDHTLHHAQPCLHSYTPGDLQDLAANGDHDLAGYSMLACRDVIEEREKLAHSERAVAYRHSRTLCSCRGWTTHALASLRTHWERDS